MATTRRRGRWGAGVAAVWVVGVVAAGRRIAPATHHDSAIDLETAQATAQATGMASLETRNTNSARARPTDGHPRRASPRKSMDIHVLGYRSEVAPLVLASEKPRRHPNAVAATHSVIDKRAKSLHRMLFR